MYPEISPYQFVEIFLILVSYCTQYSIVWKYHSISSYCPKYGRLDCLFYPATTVLQWIILWICIFELLEMHHQARFPEVEMLDQKVHAYVVLLDMAKLFSGKVISVCLPVKGESVCFPTDLPRGYVVTLSNFYPSNKWELIFQCFHLHSCNEWVWSFLACLRASLLALSVKNPPEMQEAPSPIPGSGDPLRG